MNMILINICLSREQKQMNGFRGVLIREGSSDGRMNGESKSQTRVGGITLALGGSLESIQGQRDWMLLDRR